VLGAEGEESTAHIGECLARAARFRAGDVVFLKGYAMRWSMRKHEGGV
jgi:hypothetical protein